MKEQNIFIGNTSANGIYHYKFKNGKIYKKYMTSDFERCTYLVNDNQYLYGVIEIAGTKEENYGYIVAYKKENEKLINIDKKPSYGKGPCHIEIDKENNMLFISNYIDGCLSIIKKEYNGTLGKKIYSNINNDKMSHLHCVKKIMNKSFFISVDLGANLIIAYEIKEEEIIEVSRLKLNSETDPRHIVIGKDLIYVVTERSCELYILKFQNRRLKLIDVVSILPDNTIKNEDYTGCAIKLSKNLKNIYVSVRGHNSISVFKVQKENVKMIQNIYCGGDVPRDLELDKTNKYLFSANQNSSDISIFKRNKFNGKLKYLYKEEVINPTCIIAE